MKFLEKFYLKIIYNLLNKIPKVSIDERSEINYNNTYILGVYKNLKGKIT